MWANSYALPIMITENGIADHLDANRPRFLVEHLAAVAAAIQAGANVRGYFHWSSIDNFEWVSGYCPNFGLYSVDRASTVRTRTARPSAALYRQIITAGEITDAMLMSQPAYQTPTSFCPDRAGPRDGGI
jgi:beta-glucosidase/6-phospho-beta-glucosidase/beta-galactosidase